MFFQWFNFLIQGATNVESIAQMKKQLQPYLLVTGDINEPDQVFLVVDCQVIGEVELKNLTLVLLAAYFVYNICYAKGCNNFFLFWKCYFSIATLTKHLQLSNMFSQHYIIFRHTCTCATNMQLSHIFLCICCILVTLSNHLQLCVEHFFTVVVFVQSMN